MKKKKTGKDFGLSPKQSKFCELYATDREFFGNGTQSYIEAYNPKRKGNWYMNAKAAASENLTKPNLLKYTNYLLEEEGLNDQNVDKQLLFIINQHADFKSKVAAIREYNKLKQRITDKVDHTSGGKPIVIPMEIYEREANRGTE